MFSLHSEPKRRIPADLTGILTYTGADSAGALPSIASCSPRESASRCAGAGNTNSALSIALSTSRVLCGQTFVSTFKGVPNSLNCDGRISCGTRVFLVVTVVSSGPLALTPVQCTSAPAAPSGQGPDLEVPLCTNSTSTVLGPTPA
eukprot:2770675-Rhodomonas_salina.4